MKMHFLIHKISPHPALLKRGEYSPFGKGGGRGILQIIKVLSSGNIKKS